jgi:hypothetical protein
MKPEDKGLDQLTQQLIDIAGTCVDYRKMTWIPLSALQEKQISEIKNRIRTLDELSIKDFSTKTYKEVKMEINNYISINKGALKAKFDVTIPQWGLNIRQCTYFDNGKKRWINLPTREYQDEKTGEKKHFMLVRFMSQELQDKFSNACLEKIDAMQQQPQAQSAEPPELPF